ncbi:hypothetical protein OIDMADRAFT_65034, partial [Oidiodendron maius Zn]
DHGLDVNINEESRRVLDLLNPAFEEANGHLETQSRDSMLAAIAPCLSTVPGDSSPQLNVVIQIVGSRGDVQPFISLGKVLKEKFNHRVRIATHTVFRDFVEENNLEFFNIGGDPAELMAFMVHNPGLVPNVRTMRRGEISKRRKGIYEMLVGCWRSCIESGDGTGPPIFELHTRDFNPSGTKSFIADAIIANPPSFAHIHCAEKLGVPLHLMFTMPWSPTQSFPHPLVNLKSSNADGERTNFMSYALVEMITWQGLGDVINAFRYKILNLPPISLMWAPGLSSRLRIPFTYCWSPELIPKPKDWGSHISISGFYFLSLASSFMPEPALLEFLAAGPSPVYIGFGSIVVDDPDEMTRIIFEAVRKAGIRALVSKGWGGLGAGELKPPDEVFMLENVPHDWLFKHVSAVVHHGGAGTTAAGILAGRPTVVVPFFGDQPFWGKMIYRAGAGPAPIAYKNLTVDLLVQQLLFALKPETLTKAQELGGKMAKEEGAETGAREFHRNMGEEVRCSVLPSESAIWRIKRTQIRLSGQVATVLSRHGLLDFMDLKLHRAREYQVEEGPWDPVSGVASTLLGTFGSLMMGVADIPVEAFHSIKTRIDEAKGHRESLVPLARQQTQELTSTVSLPVTKSDEPKYNHISPPALPQDDLGTGIQGKVIVSHSNSNTHVKLTSAQFSSDTGPADLKSEKTTSPTEPLTSTTSNHPSIASNSTGSPRSEYRMGAGEKGRIRERDVAHVAEAILKFPMDLSSSIAQGFHNAPKLYGDRTVRRTDNITGLNSGVKAAGKDLIFGFYDGVSGLIAQPVRGAKENGFAGLLSGVVKGVGGLLLKPTASIAGVPADTIVGIYRQLEKSTDFCLQTHLTVSRVSQGIDEASGLTHEEEQHIIRRWHMV